MVASRPTEALGRRRGAYTARRRLLGRVCLGMGLATVRMHSLLTNACFVPCTSAPLDSTASAQVMLASQDHHLNIL
jgi:hypothetical protein